MREEERRGGWGKRERGGKREEIEKERGKEREEERRERGEGREKREKVHAGSKAELKYQFQGDGDTANIRSLDS